MCFAFKFPIKIYVIHSWRVFFLTSKSFWEHFHMDEMRKNIGYEIFFLLKLIFAINIRRLCMQQWVNIIMLMKGYALTIIFVTYNTSFVSMCYFINVSLKYIKVGCKPYIFALQLLCAISIVPKSVHIVFVSWGSS